MLSPEAEEIPKCANHLMDRYLSISVSCLMKTTSWNWEGIQTSDIVIRTNLIKFDFQVSCITKPYY